MEDEYEVYEYEEGMEDAFCSMDEEGNIHSISYIKTPECYMPCIDTIAGFFPIMEGMKIADDGVSKFVVEE